MGDVLHLPPRYPLRAQWLVGPTEAYADVGVLRLVVDRPGHPDRRAGWRVLGHGLAAEGHWRGSLERTQYECECTASAALQDTMAQLGDE